VTAEVVVSGLSKRFDRVVGADGVSFEVPRGSLLTLLGPSGSGKTTTLMMIAGFVEPDAGTIRVAGRDITRLPPNRRGLGVVFQSYALFPHRTVFENVAFPLEIRRTDRATLRREVDRMLDLVQLAPFRDQSVTTLSGGQKQRVALARALAFAPPVLLMDEPLGALDKKLREHMQGEIKALQRTLGVTALFVTHDQEEALVLSDLIAVMNDGRIVQLGPPARLYEEPANRFVAEFLGGVNLFPAQRVERRGDELRAEIAPGLLVPCHATATTEGTHVGIRPERVRLGEAEPLFRATILRQTYLGGAMVHELRAEAGFDLAAKAALGDGAAPPPVGAEIGVGWSAKAAWLLA
jgi:ABC-type Fe3+/spermidine/putrescine transport system ATPase subunit